MIAYHISVFAENRPGRLDHITGVLAQANINIRAIKISDLGEHGVVKMLVDDPDTAYHVLKQAGVLVSQKEIIAVGVEDRPGGLHAVLKSVDPAADQCGRRLRICIARSGGSGD